MSYAKILKQYSLLQERINQRSCYRTFMDNFKEVVLNMIESAAVMEARRCLKCNLETEEGKKAISG